MLREKAKWRNGGDLRGTGKMLDTETILAEGNDEIVLAQKDITRV